MADAHDTTVEIEDDINIENNSNSDNQVETFEEQPTDMATPASAEVTTTAESTNNNEEEIIDTTDMDESKIVKIQALHRGKQDRKKVADIKNQQQQDSTPKSIESTNNNEEEMIDTTDMDESKIVKIQAMHRGKQDRKKVADIKNQQQQDATPKSVESTNNNDEEIIDTTDMDESKIVKIQAMHRGKQDRKKVADIKNQQQQDSTPKSVESTNNNEEEMIDTTDMDESKIVKIQAMHRGKQDRKKVADIKNQQQQDATPKSVESTNNNDEEIIDTTDMDESKIVKIQAMHRGKQDRKKVADIKNQQQQEVSDLKMESGRDDDAARDKQHGKQKKKLKELRLEGNQEALQETAAVQIQSLCRGGRDRRRVKKIKQSRSVAHSDKKEKKEVVEENDRDSLDGDEDENPRNSVIIPNISRNDDDEDIGGKSMEDEIRRSNDSISYQNNAAVKIQSLARGGRDRQRVQKIREDKEQMHRQQHNNSKSPKPVIPAVVVLVLSLKYESVVSTTAKKQQFLQQLRIEVAKALDCHETRFVLGELKDGSVHAEVKIVDDHSSSSSSNNEPSSAILAMSLYQQGNDATSRLRRGGILGRRVTSAYMSGPMADLKTSSTTSLPSPTPQQRPSPPVEPRASEPPPPRQSYNNNNNNNNNNVSSSNSYSVSNSNNRFFPGKDLESSPTSSSSPHSENSTSGVSRVKRTAVTEVQVDQMAAALSRKLASVEESIANLQSHILQLVMCDNEEDIKALGDANKKVESLIKIRDQIYIALQHQQQLAAPSPQAAKPRQNNINNNKMISNNHNNSAAEIQAKISRQLDHQSSIYEDQQQQQQHYLHHSTSQQQQHNNKFQENVYNNSNNNKTNLPPVRVRPNSQKEKKNTNNIINNNMNNNAIEVVESNFDAEAGGFSAGPQQGKLGKLRNVRAKPPKTMPPDTHVHVEYSIPEDNRDISGRRRALALSKYDKSPAAVRFGDSRDNVFKQRAIANQVEIEARWAKMNERPTRIIQPAPVNRAGAMSDRIFPSIHGGGGGLGARGSTRPW